MLDAEVNGARLTDGQIVAFLFLLISATNESTGKQIGLALYHGWRQPGIQRAGLNGRASDWANEALRYDSPSQMMARTLTEETVLHGTRVPEGARVVLLPASGNRDGRVFADPDTFDLDRDTGDMISFGHGPHFCPGAGLAQLEITIALEEIVRSSPGTTSTWTTRAGSTPRTSADSPRCQPTSPVGRADPAARRSCRAHGPSICDRHVWTAPTASSSSTFSIAVSPAVSSAVVPPKPSRA
jgi:cytochrome P450